MGVDVQHTRQLMVLCVQEPVQKPRGANSGGESRGASWKRHPEVQKGRYCPVFSTENQKRTGKNVNYSDETWMTSYYLRFPLGVPKATGKEFCVCVCVCVCVCQKSYRIGGTEDRKIVFCFHYYYLIIISMFVCTEKTSFISFTRFAPNSTFTSLSFSTQI